MPRRSLLLASIALLAVGCGGSSHSSPAKSALAHVAVDWPETGRDVQAPGSAHLASITLASTGAKPASVTFNGVRPSGTAATTQTYAATTALPTGVYLLTVHFMTSVDGTGVETATATAVVSLGADGTLRRTDGTALGAIAFDGKVASVTVVPDQRVGVGDTLYVLFSALDASGKPLAIGPEAAQVSIVQYGDKAQSLPYARVKGTAIGKAVVEVSVDGVSSPNAYLTVDGVPIMTRDVSLATSGLVADPSRGKLWVSLPAGTVADLDPASGTLGTPIAVGSQPATLALTDDSSILYVGLLTDRAVRPVDLASRTPGGPLTLDAAFRGGYPYRVVPAPGSNTTVAITANQTGIAVFDNGVARPNALQGDFLDVAVWTSPTRLVAYSSHYDDTVEEATLDANGLTPGHKVQGKLSSSSQDFRLFGGALYDAHGLALDAVSLAAAKGFPGFGYPSYLDENAGPVVDAAANRVYFLDMNGSPYVTDAARLLVFRLDDHTLLSNRPFANVERASDWSPNEDPGFTAWGAHGIAFRTPHHVYLIDDATTL